MTDNTAPTNTPELAPYVVGPWLLNVTDVSDPVLLALVEMEIFYQDQNASDTSVYGSINSKGPETSKFSLDTGAIEGSQFISFTMTVGGQLYQFNGQIKTPQQMYGSVTIMDGNLQAQSDQGSWSAQAQDGSGDYTP
jgi:hypothetical protein